MPLTRNQSRLIHQSLILSAMILVGAVQYVTVSGKEPLIAPRAMKTWTFIALKKHTPRYALKRATLTSLIDAAFTEAA
jgi:hypothetical protein